MPLFTRPLEPDAFEARLRALSDRKPFEFPDGALPARFRPASVLIAFWREAEAIRVLLTRRAAHLSAMPGQMAFPGGKVEPGEDFLTAALREAQEEVSLDPSAVEVLGRLDDAWSGAGHRLVSIVGWLAAPPILRPDPAEVDTIHRPALDTLLAPDAHYRQPIELDGRRFHNDTLRFDDGEVFGLTTDLLVEAIRHGLGESPNAGARRLETLRAWRRDRGE